MLLDSDWIKLSDFISEDWADHLTGTLALIGSMQREGARLRGEMETPVNVDKVFKETVKWLSATTNCIDNEDAKIVGRVGNMFTLFWFVAISHFGYNVMYKMTFINPFTPKPA